MIDSNGYANQRIELGLGFAKYVLDNPEVDEQLPRKFYLYFEIVGDDAFNARSREMAARHKLEPGYRPVCVRVDGLARSAKGVRLLNPVIKVVRQPARLSNSPKARRPLAGTRRKSA